MLFFLVPFWTISPDEKVIRLSGVKSIGREAEKGKTKNNQVHLVCTEAFLGVSAHQSNLITIGERLEAKQIRQYLCLGGRSSFNSCAVSLPALYLFSYMISSLIWSTFRAHGQAPVVLSVG